MVTLEPSSQIQAVNDKRQGHFWALPLGTEKWLLGYFFKNLLFPYPASKINPMPNSMMVAGSGTG
jgi:hypothetical protein